MKNKLLLVTALSTLALTLAACSDTDPSQLGIARRSNPTAPVDGTPPPASETPDASIAPDEADASNADASNEAGAKDAGADADGGDASAAVGAFTGAGAYVATTGPSTIKGAHGGNGSPAKLACQGCHGAGGGAPLFFTGGSVFKDAAGTVPVAQAEVRVRDAAGKTVSAYTDATGSFFVRQSTATAAGIALPVQVGVRDATTTKLMSATIANGDCNSSACHGGAQGRAHLP